MKEEGKDRECIYTYCEHKGEKWKQCNNIMDGLSFEYTDRHTDKLDLLSSFAKNKVFYFNIGSNPNIRSSLCTFLRKQGFLVFKKQIVLF